MRSGKRCDSTVLPRGFFDHCLPGALPGECNHGGRQNDAGMLWTFRGPSAQNLARRYKLQIASYKSSPVGSNAGCGEPIVENAARTLDFTPAGVLAGGGDAVVGLEAAIATLRAIYKPGSPKAEAAGLQIVTGFDDALQFAIQASAPIRKRLVGEVVAHDAAWWARWLAGARDASHAVCDAYWCLSPSQSTAGPEPVRHRLAVSVVEALKWSACDRFSPDETLWARISQLFANSAEFSDSVIGGDRPGIGREYLRAVAYYSANLDQAELNMAIALVHLIDLSLPFLELTRKAGHAPQYAVYPSRGSIPVRRASERDQGEWYFAPWAADELLANFEVHLEAGRVPKALGALPSDELRPALKYLRSQWSMHPPVRNRRRFPQDAGVMVARGFPACLAVLRGEPLPAPRSWRVLDFSRSGLHILANSDPTRAWPDIGELLGVHFVDGEGWQLGIVRRLRMGPSHAELGIELIAWKPSIAVIDDGQFAVEGVLCDAPEKGGVIRLLTMENTPDLAEPLFLRGPGAVIKLRPLETLVHEGRYKLVAYQVQ